jgi:hypothetical protein
MGYDRRNMLAMANLRRSFIYILFISVLFVLVVGFSQATLINFRLQGGEEVTHSINLVAEDRVLIQIKLVGGNVSAIQFSIYFPNATVRDFGASGDFSYSFICDVEGEYVLHFVNTDHAENQVFLDYEVQHYIFGIPQMLFMVILIAIISVVGVAIFIGLSPKP